MKHDYHDYVGKIWNKYENMKLLMNKSVHVYTATYVYMCVHIGECNGMSQLK